MNCAEVLESLPPYLSGELDRESAAGVQAHLAACAGCAREFRQQTEVDDQVRHGMLAEELDTRRLDARIRRHITGRRAIRRWIGIAAAVVVALVLTALVYRFTAGAGSVYAAAARDHRSEVILHQHRTWFTDRASLESLAAREGVARSVVFNLAPAGYHLDRAKFCRLAGNVFLHLVYSDGTQEFSVFLRSRDGSDVNSVQSVDLAQEKLAVFRTERLDGMIVTAGSNEDALKFARSAQAALSPGVL